MSGPRYHPGVRPPSARRSSALLGVVAVAALFAPFLLGSSLAGCSVSECAYNSDCPSGLCVDGKCNVECYASIDCPDDRKVCSRGVCTKGDAGVDGGDGSVPDGDAATDGKPDGADSTLPDTGDTASPDTDPGDTDPGDTTPTDTGTDTGPKGALFDRCTGDGECTSGRCTPAAPRFCTKACTASSECPDGLQCAGGICQLDDTGKAGCNVTTGAGCQNYCIGTTSASHCTHKCASAADCPAGFACSNVGGTKVCIDIERPCGTADQCPGSLGFCGSGGLGCTATCDSAADCPLRLVGLPAYACSTVSGKNVCVPPSDVLGSSSLGATCSATGTNLCRSGACDGSTSPASCAQRCTVRGGCPSGWGCFPLEDTGPPKSTLLVCSVVTGTGFLGDSCTRGRDCLTALCQAGAGGGYCTRLCVDGLCPTGMTCAASGLSATDGTPIKLCTK